MADSSQPETASQTLKRLRSRVGFSMAQMAAALSVQLGRHVPLSSYQHYEDRYKKPYLPLELIEALKAVFRPLGVPESELAALVADAEKADDQAEFLHEIRGLRDEMRLLRQAMARLASESDHKS